MKITTSAPGLEDLERQARRRSKRKSRKAEMKLRGVKTRAELRKARARPLFRDPKTGEIKLWEDKSLRGVDMGLDIV